MNNSAELQAMTYSWNKVLNYLFLTIMSEIKNNFSHKRFCNLCILNDRKGQTFLFKVSMFKKYFGQTNSKIISLQISLQNTLANVPSITF